MRKVWALLLVMGLGLAQEFKPSVALTGGNLVGFGVEASWNCLLYQPPVGVLRPTLDLALDTNLRGAFLMRYLYGLGQGLQAGGGLGLTFGPVNPYLRADAEYDLPAGLGLPLFLGADLGTDLNRFLAHLKVGVRF